MAYIIGHRKSEISMELRSASVSRGALFNSQ
ncbi:hypothetical protein FOWG_14374 [Fusarium oxysporum f. sp. lycopersici MN25]|nr:hypothetical protein FOWG_14374 [Fusarium oxysporum f. sp. lycopersici MN25]